MKISQWFDANNIGHLKAYRHLERNGFWPTGFIPEDIEFENGWHILVLSKLADALLDEKIGKQ